MHVKTSCLHTHAHTHTHTPQDAWGWTDTECKRPASQRSWYWENESVRLSKTVRERAVNTSASPYLPCWCSGCYRKHNKYVLVISTCTYLRSASPLCFEGKYLSGYNISIASPGHFTPPYSQCVSSIHTHIYNVHVHSCMWLWTVEAGTVLCIDRAYIPGIEPLLQYMYILLVRVCIYIGCLFVVSIGMCTCTCLCKCMHKETMVHGT